jgi:hypothetical protein
MRVKLISRLGDTQQSGLELDRHYAVHVGPDPQGTVVVFDDHTTSFCPLTRAEYREVPDPLEPHDLLRVDQEPGGYQGGLHLCVAPLAAGGRPGRGRRCPPAASAAHGAPGAAAHHGGAPAAAGVDQRPTGPPAPPPWGVRAMSRPNRWTATMGSGEVGG